MFYLLLSSILRFLLALDFALIAFLTFLFAYLPMAISKHIIPFMFRLTCKSLLRFLGTRYHIHQKFRENLPKRYILISNHPSGMDLLLLNALFTVYPLAKEGVKKWFLFGRITRAMGAVFVKREDKESRKIAKEKLAQYAKEGKNLLIYPEGGCFGKHLRPFKYGAFEISMNSGIPILPIYLQYEAENTYEWGDYGLVYHLYELFISPNKHVHCYIFPPIQPEKFQSISEYNEYVHRLYETWEVEYRHIDCYEDFD